MYPQSRFFHDTKIVPILSYANGNSDRSSEVIDTAGYGACAIVVHFADINNSGVNQIYLRSSDAATNENTLSSPSNVATSAQSIDATNADNDVKVIDFIPQHRYYQLVVDKDGTNACAESAIAYLYQPTNRPVTQATGNTTVGEGTGEVLGEVLNLATQGTI